MRHRRPDEGAGDPRQPAKRNAPQLLDLVVSGLELDSHPLGSFWISLHVKAGRRRSFSVVLMEVSCH